MYRHAVKLVAKCGKNWMKNIVFRCEHNLEIHLLHMCIRYFHFMSQMNWALKITSAMGVPDLVKIDDEFHPLALTKEIISLLWKWVWSMHGRNILPFRF